ncbi:hypothetical protein GmHk_06G017354 [Glycine max]|nr:hypothetical protein GmHk_06G017354 [Glycine max]
MQVGGYNICGGSHESGCCISQDDSAKEVNYIGNQNGQGFHSGNFLGYQQGGSLNQNQGQRWRSHPGNQFNKDQGGPSNRPPNQWPNLYERTTKLEETLAQLMQVSMSNHKSTESAIKNLEIRVGQLAKQITESSSRGLRANTEKNPKEECKAIMTRSKREIVVENESRTHEEKELEVEGEKEKEGDQMEEREINEVEEEENEKNTKKNRH